MRKIGLSIFVMLSLVLDIGCKDRNVSKIPDISENASESEQSTVDFEIEELSHHEEPVRITKVLSTYYHKLDTIIDDYHIYYKKQQSSDTTDLVGPFDINYQPADWVNISSYDTILFYNAHEIKIAIDQLIEGGEQKVDTITITREKIADFLGLDLEKELAQIDLTSIYLDKVRQDTITFSLGFYEVDSDAGYGIGYVWTANGDSLYIEPEIWED